MGRKPIDLGPDADARITAMLERGATVEAITAAFAGKASPQTIARRVRVLRGKDRQSPRLIAKAAASSAALPNDEGDDEGEALAATTGASVEEIDRWLKVAKTEADKAEAKGDRDSHVKYVRLATTLLEARRKAMPVPKVDPNDHPDMVEAAQRARERLHKLADSLVRVASSPLAERISALLKGES